MEGRGRGGSVVTGKRAELTAEGGYVLDPFSSMKINGWRYVQFLKEKTLLRKLNLVLKVKLLKKIYWY